MPLSMGDDEGGTVASMACHFIADPRISRSLTMLKLPDTP